MGSRNSSRRYLRAARTDLASSETNEIIKEIPQVPEVTRFDFYD